MSSLRHAPSVISPNKPDLPVRYFSYDAAQRKISLAVHIQPGAKSSAIAGLHDSALKIRIAAPAVDNKANAALVNFLGEALELRSASMRIRHGHTGRRKVIEIADVGPALAARLRVTLDELVS